MVINIKITPRGFDVNLNWAQGPFAVINQDI